MKEINIRFDRRTELLSVLFWLSDYKTKYSFIVNTESNSLFSYAQNFFANSNYNYVVSLFEKLVNVYDMDFDAPVALFLQFSEDMTSYHLEDYPYISRLNQNPLVVELMDAAIKFYDESNFEEYFQSNQKYYNEILDKDCSLHLMHITDVMKQIYGDAFEKYNFSINITSATTNGGYCVTIGDHVICSSGLLDGTIYLYDSMILHEFSHHFINPLTVQYMKDEDKLDPSLFADIMDNVEKQGYRTNDTIINEYIIRAIECCFCELKALTYFNEHIQFNLLQGFKDIEYVYYLVKTKVFNMHQQIQDVYSELLESFVLYLRNKIN